MFARAEEVGRGGGASREVPSTPTAALDEKNEEEEEEEEQAGSNTPPRGAEGGLLCVPMAGMATSGAMFGSPCRSVGETATAFMFTLLVMQGSGFRVQLLRFRGKGSGYGV
jgi:hypothetical protein